MEVLHIDFNEKEAELRNHSDYGEVFEDDLKALSMFRQTGNLGAFLIEDDDEKAKEETSAVVRMSVANSGMKRRLSHASSISSIVSKSSTLKSLSPLPEEKKTGDENEDGAEEKEARHSPIEEESEEESPQKESDADSSEGQKALSTDSPC